MGRDGSVFSAMKPKPSPGEYAKAIKAMKAFRTMLERNEGLEWGLEESRTNWEKHAKDEAVVAAHFGIIYISLTLHYPIDIGEAVADAIHQADKVYIYIGSYGTTDEDNYDRSTVLSIEPVDFSLPDVKLVVRDNPKKVRSLTSDG